MHSAEAVKETMSPAITPTLLAITTSHAPLANYSLPSLHALLTNATSSTLVMHALAPPPPMDDDAGYAPPPPSPVKDLINAIASSLPMYDANYAGTSTTSLSTLINLKGAALSLGEIVESGGEAAKEVRREEPAAAAQAHLTLCTLARPDAAPDPDRQLQEDAPARGARLLPGPLDLRPGAPLL
jgi:hypothetical protein